MNRGVLTVVVGTFLLAATATAWVPVEPRVRFRTAGTVTRRNGDVEAILVRTEGPWWDRDWLWRSRLSPPDAPATAWRPWPDDSPPRAIVRWRQLLLEVLAILALGGLLAVAIQTLAARRAARIELLTARPVDDLRRRRRALLVGLSLVAAAAGYMILRPRTMVEASVLSVELPRERSLVVFSEPITIALRSAESIPSGTPDLVLQAPVARSALDALARDYRALARQRLDTSPRPRPTVIPVQLDVDPRLSSAQAIAAADVLLGCDVDRAELGVFSWSPPSLPVPVAKAAIGGPITPPSARSVDRLSVEASASLAVFIASDGSSALRTARGARTAALPPAQLRAELKIHFDTIRDGRMPFLSGCAVLLHADRDAAWGHVERVVRECARIGIWRCYLVVAPTTRE